MWRHRESRVASRPGARTLETDGRTPLRQIASYACPCSPGSCAHINGLTLYVKRNDVNIGARGDAAPTSAAGLGHCPISGCSYGTKSMVIFGEVLFRSYPT